MTEQEYFALKIGDVVECVNCYVDSELFTVTEINEIVDWVFANRPFREVVVVDKGGIGYWRKYIYDYVTINNLDNFRTVAV